MEYILQQENYSIINTTRLSSLVACCSSGLSIINIFLILSFICLSINLLAIYYVLFFILKLDKALLILIINYFILYFIQLVE